MKIFKVASALGIGAVLVAMAAFSLAETPAPRGGFAPDPPGIATKKQWSFSIDYHDGKANVDQVEAVYLQNPATTARVMGRFAVEFWVGKELLDRIRFEVPLLDDPSMHRKGALSGPRFGNVSTHLKVRLADNARATVVVVVDRSTGDTQRFAWPPAADGHLVPLGAPKVVPLSSVDAGDAGPEIPPDASDGGR